MIQSQTSPILKSYYSTQSICPYCEKILPGEVIAREAGVFVARDCPEHGHVEGLTCSDIGWYESLSKFDVKPQKPQGSGKTPLKGCPLDCGLCSSHRQSAGTAALEISNRCNLSCPVCLADNRGTFELSVEQVRETVETFLKGQKSIDAFTISGGEPTIHPGLFGIIRVLERPEISRIVINSNGLRIAEDDDFLDRLSQHPNVYVSLHHDGKAAREIRGIDFSVQEKALHRLLEWKIKVVPLVLGVKSLNDKDLGKLISKLLVQSVDIKSIIVSIMANCGSRGSGFNVHPEERLTIPEALIQMETESNGSLRKSEFIPLPMPNPLCAAIGYFLVDGQDFFPLISLMDLDRVIDFTKNAHFARAEKELESLLRDTIELVYSNPRKSGNPERLLGAFKALLTELFPSNRTVSAEERRAIVETRIKTVYLMQFMDTWTFDSVRMSKCSCQHLLPGGTVIPSCGYYALHRKSDSRFSS